MGTDNLFKKRKKTTKFARQKPNLNPKKVILIVCEGEKTEKNYFKMLKEFLKLTNIHIKSSKHPTPTQIVKTAKAETKEGEYDAIYCVFDKDKHADFDKALQEIEKHKKRKKNKKCELYEIVSAPCFEFWILLHFVYTDKDFENCDEVRKHKNFKDNLPNYQKDYDFKELIEKYLQTAIDNANKINLQEKKPPYTQVVKLVERLQELAKENNCNSEVANANALH